MELTIDQALQQGVAAHKEGKLQDAERLYRAILQAQPKHPDANHNLGVLAVAVGRPLEALTFFKQALDANLKVEQFWVSYIDALIRVDRLDEAREVLANGEQSGVSAEKLGAFYQQLQVSVSKDANKAAKKQTLSEKRKRLAEKKKSKKRKGQGASPGKEPSQDQLNQLVDHYQAGKLEDAETLARSLTQKFPKHPFAWKVLGSVLKQAGRLNESVLPMQKCLELSPQDADAHNNLGATLQDLGRPDKAEASYKQAIVLKPDSAEVHSNLGNTLTELGNLDEAEVSLRQAIALKPELAEAHYNLGNTLKELGRLDDAEASYRQAIALKPDYAEAHSNLGVTLKDLGRLDESIGCLKQAIELNSDLLQARVNLDSTIRSAVPGWHFPMMNDEERTIAYSEALKLAVRDGDFVLDIGTGSGLLSLMAAANGAEMVITCEMSEIIAEAATQIIKSNGYEEKICVLNKKSTNLVIGVDLPKQADLIISEVFSSELVGEGVRATALDANRRLLKKGGRTIPQSGKIKIALIDDSPEISYSTSVASVQGFDLSLFNSISPKKFSSKLRDKPVLLSNPADAFHINLSDAERTVGREKIIELRVDQDGLCVGLVQWIWIHLYEDIEYENKPGECDSHWQTPIYLFDEPVVVKKGDVIEVKGLLGEDYVWFCKWP